MSEKWTLSTLFVLGLLYGRKSSAKQVEVPPRIIHIPPQSPVLPSSSPVNLETTVNELLKSLESHNIKIEREKLIKIAEIVQRRDLCLERIKEASKAFMEGRISRSVYVFLVEFYQRKLIEAESLISELIKVKVYERGR